MVRPPEHINEEPAVILGCTASELSMLLALSVGIGLIGAIVSALVTGALIISGVLGLLGLVGLTLQGAKLLQRLKRDRPPGWHAQAFRLARIRLQRTSPHVWQTRTWDIGRRL